MAGFVKATMMKKMSLLDQDLEEEEYYCLEGIYIRLLE